MGRPVSFGDDFAGLFNWFTTRAFRLETLDQYAVGYEEEAMRRFLAGQPVDPGFIAAWLEQVAAATSAGRQMQRVHVVTEPLSDYLRYEMDGYRHSVAAGEDVRVLPRPMAHALEVPKQDFWLFDDGPVARMHYDEQGRFLGAELVEEADVVARYCRWRDVAWEAATPYARYVVQLSGTATAGRLIAGRVAVASDPVTHYRSSGKIVAFTTTPRATPARTCAGV